MEVKRFGKKGMFFTITGVILLFFFLSIYATDTSINSVTSVGYDDRILVVNDFLESVQADATFALETGTLRGLLAMTEYISQSGTFIDNTTLRMNELLLNETLYDETYFVMSNNSFVTWEARMDAYLSQFNLVATFTFGDVVLNQSSPWSVDAYVPFKLELTDLLSNARWNTTKILQATVPIAEISDPLYIIGTSNTFVLTFNKTPYVDFVNGVDTTNLADHIANGYYHTFSDAPSFLMRFEGDFGEGGPYGIESLVDKETLALYIPITEFDSNADYVYFGPSDPIVYNFSFVPTYFHLDNNSNSGQSHIEHYGLEDLVS